MIGLGKWSGEINTSVLSGTALVEIKDNGGQYDFSITVPGADKLPEFTVYNVTESGNTLSGKADIMIMGKITVDITAEFNGDTFVGFIKVPFLGKIDIKNGRRIIENE